jgi:hypothetical protein
VTAGFNQRKLLSSFISEVKIGTRAVKGVHRLDEVSELRFFARRIKTATAGQCAESNNLNT